MCWASAGGQRNVSPKAIDKKIKYNVLKTHLEFPGVKSTQALGHLSCDSESQSAAGSKQSQFSE